MYSIETEANAAESHFNYNYLTSYLGTSDNDSSLFSLKSYPKDFNAVRGIMTSSVKVELRGWSEYIRSHFQRCNKPFQYCIISIVRLIQCAVGFSIEKGGAAAYRFAIFQYLPIVNAIIRKQCWGHRGGLLKKPTCWNWNLFPKRLSGNTASKINNAFFAYCSFRLKFMNIIVHSSVEPYGQCRGAVDGGGGKGNKFNKWKFISTQYMWE